MRSSLKKLFFVAVYFGFFSSATNFFFLFHYFKVSEKIINTINKFSITHGIKSPFLRIIWGLKSKTFWDSTF